MRQINAAGLELIKSFEGCKLTSYQDIVGKWTVGYGHVGEDVISGMDITQEAADSLLMEDLSKFEDGVSLLVKLPINDNQFSALVCFSYNLGLENLKKSMLLRCINMHNTADAANEFLKWGHAGGKVVPGLVRRREAERALFIS